VRPRNLALLAVLPLMTMTAACSGDSVSGLPTTGLGVAMTMTAACSGDSVSGLPTTGLGVAMTMIADTPATAGYVEYGDTARLRGQQELTLRGYGWSSLATATALVKDRLGIDPDKTDPLAL